MANVCVCVGCRGCIVYVSLCKNSCKDDFALVSWFLGAGEHVPPIPKVHMQRRVIGLLYTSHILQYSAFHSARIHILLVHCAMSHARKHVLCRIQSKKLKIFASWKVSCCWIQGRSAALVTTPCPHVKNTFLESTVHTWGEGRGVEGSSICAHSKKTTYCREGPKTGTQMPHFIYKRLHFWTVVYKIYIFLNECHERHMSTWHPCTLYSKAHTVHSCECTPNRRWTHTVESKEKLSKNGNWLGVLYR